MNDLIYKRYKSHPREYDNLIRDIQNERRKQHNKRGSNPKEVRKEHGT